MKGESQTRNRTFQIGWHTEITLEDPGTGTGIITVKGGLAKKHYFSYAETYDENRYDAYRDQILPEGYTPYDGHAESIYTFDQYEYDLAEPQTARRPTESFGKRMRSFCSDMGRLIHLSKNCMWKILNRNIPWVSL